MEMNPYYQAALNGTLSSPAATGDPMTVRFVNESNIALGLSFLDVTAQRCGLPSWQPGAAPYELKPRTMYDLQWAHEGDIYLVTSLYSGAFAAVLSLAFPGAFWPLIINPRLFLDPGDIGDVPSPNARVIIPGNSPRVVVGSARLPNGNGLSREQYWQRMPNSYSLAPREKRTVSYTVTSGMTSTSSDQKTSEETAGASIGAGWGPFSAHVSSQLSHSSTSDQSVTITSQTTSYNQNQYENLTDSSQYVLVWQLTDELTIFDEFSGKPVSSVTTLTQPPIVAGPYNPGNLPPRPSPGLPDGEPPNLAAVANPDLPAAATDEHRE